MDSTDRSFAVVAVYKPGQKMTRSNYNHGRYISKNHRDAASKALTTHCNAKKIRGVCTLVVVVQETTAGSAKKMRAYKGKRKLNKTTVEMDGKPVTFKFAPNKMEAVAVPAYVHAFSK
jgi:hypothetical protein